MNICDALLFPFCAFPPRPDSSDVVAENFFPDLLPDAGLGAVDAILLPVFLLFKFLKIEETR